MDPGEEVEIDIELHDPEFESVSQEGWSVEERNAGITKVRSELEEFSKNYNQSYESHWKYETPRGTHSDWPTTWFPQKILDLKLTTRRPKEANIEDMKSKDQILKDYWAEWKSRHC